MFKAKKFLVDHFQSAQRLVAVLRSHGLSTPQEFAVEKWFARGSVPGSWLPVLLVCLEIEHGAPVSLTAYVGGDDVFS